MVVMLMVSGYVAVAVYVEDIVDLTRFEYIIGVG